MANVRREKRYDAALLGILKEEEKIASFLDIIFGFLYERTDFYLDFDATGGALGFKPGEAEKIVLKVFGKYQKWALLNAERKKENVKIKELKCAKTSELSADLTAVGSEVEIACEAEKDTFKSTSDEQKNTELKEKKAEARPFASDSYNGAVLENYDWSQSITDVDVRIPVPRSVKTSKMVKVELENKHLKASIKDVNSDWKVMVDGQFTWKINLEKSMWTFAPGEYIHVNLEKCEERWWESLLVGEPKIDVSQIDSERSMTDLPDEEQSKIEELIYDQRQKEMGKPTREEMKIHDLMKEAWNKPGSPFQGQEFDPSLYNLGCSNLSQSES